MSDLPSFGEILAQLSLNSEPGLIYNILIYIIFFMLLIAFFMQDDKQLITTLLLGLVLAFLVIAKLDLARQNFPDGGDFAMLLINAAIFVVPLMVTGMSKAKKSKPLTLIGGVIGGFYFFMYWFFLQRNL